MGLKRTKQVNAWYGQLEDMRAGIEEIKIEKQDAYDSKSEKWQEGDKAQEAQEAIDALDELYTALDEAVDKFDNAYEND